MSYHEGSNWQAKKEDLGKPLYEDEKRIPINKDLKWYRYRFYTHSEDNRPIIFNPKFPWWCSGYGEDSKGEYSVCIAYLPKDENLYKYWEDASNVEFTEESEIKFSDRFPKPKYFKG